MILKINDKEIVYCPGLTEHKDIVPFIQLQRRLLRATIRESFLALNKIHFSNIEMYRFMMGDKVSFAFSIGIIGSVEAQKLLDWIGGWNVIS